MYDFENVINRHGTGSAKYEQMLGWNPEVSPSNIPFSVADMELKIAPEIIEGLKELLDTTVLGYTIPTSNYFDAVISWMKKRHGWDVKKEWILQSPGVVPAFFTAVKAYSNPGDGIIIMSPVYYPFYMAMEKNGRRIVKSPLINDGKTYTIDFDDLETKAKDPLNKVLLFCSPHNPVGRVWTKEELEKVGKICLDNNVVVISDEIHNDLIMPGFKHTVFASISDEIANNTIVCTAPSKTFNLAGLQTSNIIIPNEALRNGYLKESEANGFFSLNIFGYKSCEIAYNQCEPWLEQLIELVEKNYKESKKYLAENLPEVKVYDLEGTYLLWMDLNSLEMSNEELESLMHNDAQVFFDEGYIFGEEGSGYERMNLACPTWAVMEGLERMVRTINNKK